jgi:putative transposase
MVTAATLYKQRLFDHADKLTLLEDHLLSLTKQQGWQLEAWAVFSNHYHFVARSKQGCAPLDGLLAQLHTDTAREINRLDQQTGRRV